MCIQLSVFGDDVDLSLTTNIIFWFLQRFPFKKRLRDSFVHIYALTKCISYITKTKKTLASLRYLQSCKS